MKPSELANLPPVVSAAEWEAAREALLVKEKAMTRALDDLAAERRRMPMTRFGNDYVFDGPDGKATLLDLFEGRPQLLVYHYMLDPGTTEHCPGCAGTVDGFGHPAPLHARNTSVALVSRAPLAELERFKRRMGWTWPWYSCDDTRFNEDAGVGTGFGLSAFLTDGQNVYRTYFTTARGVDRIRSDLTLLDHTPLGRQEAWEDSPEGWPQTAPYEWWRLHDEYDSI